MAGTLREKVLSAVATGTSVAVDVLGYNNVTMFVEFGAGTSAGVVTFEAAATGDYAGTWAVIGALTWAAVSSAQALGNVATGATRVHGAVRARISTNITGGTVDVWIVGN